MNVHLQTKPTLKLECRGPRANWAVELWAGFDGGPLVLWNGYGQGLTWRDALGYARGLVAESGQLDLATAKGLKAYTWDLAHADQPEPEAVAACPRVAHFTLWDYLEHFAAYTLPGALACVVVAHATAEPPDYSGLRPYG